MVLKSGKIALIALVVLAVCTISACGGSSARDPEQIARRYVDLIVAGKCAEAKSLLDPAPWAFTAILCGSDTGGDGTADQFFLESARIDDAKVITEPERVTVLFTGQFVPLNAWSKEKMDSFDRLGVDFRQNNGEWVVNNVHRLY